jgi:hypothetical protein
MMDFLNKFLSQDDIKMLEKIKIPDNCKLELMSADDFAEILGIFSENPDFKNLIPIFTNNEDAIICLYIAGRWKGQLCFLDEPLEPIFKNLSTCINTIENGTLEMIRPDLMKDDGE